MDQKKQTPEPPAEGATRRGFLARAGGAAVGLCAVGAAAGSARLAWPDAGPGLDSRVPLGRPGDFNVNTLTWVRERDLFVVRDERGFGAFSARCTHLGCTVQRTAEGFDCPCHGASFDRQGRVTSGPARRDLPWFELWLEPDGWIWVDTGAPVDAGTRRLELTAPRSSPPPSGDPA